MVTIRKSPISRVDLNFMEVISVCSILSFSSIYWDFFFPVLSPGFPSSLFCSTFLARTSISFVRFLYSGFL